MVKVVDKADSKSSSDKEGEADSTSNVDLLGLDLPPRTVCSEKIGEDLASSSGSNLKSYFIGMGFSSTLVEKVIQENSEDNVDVMLETLFTYSALQKSNLTPSDSLDDIVNHCKDVNSSPESAADSWEMEGLDGTTEVNEDKRESLLMMNFSIEEVNFAINRLGEDTPVNELVDFILAAQTAEGSRKDMDYSSHDNTVNNEDITTDTLFGTMDKTLRLLEMGFSENEISTAIEKFGSEIPISVLAESIFSNHAADTHIKKNKDPSTLHHAYGSKQQNGSKSIDNGNESFKFRSSKSAVGKSEGSSSKPVPRVKETAVGKSEGSSSIPVPRVKETDYDNVLKWKRPKQEYMDDSTTLLGHLKSEKGAVEPKTPNFQMPSLKEHHLEEEPLETKPSLRRSITQTLAKPPYFLYGNVVDISQETWTKISQFVYAIEPEFVNTQFFSALNRKEGYIHNLPTENRSYILPRPNMTIEDMIPNSKKWWPSWDSRKQLSSISSETEGVSQLCERLGRILTASQGVLSTEQQRDILHHCKTLNLVWVNQYKLGPIKPEQVESILGYPLNHTHVAKHDPERLKLLKHCFQTDTLGYYLSVLKEIFPDGLNLLSLYSGIGGAEIALYRLGIRLKAVVSVEHSETNRKILKNWWYNEGQTGNLLQLEDIHRLTSTMLERLVKELGGFDLVICQNPCTYTSGSSKSPIGGENPAGLDFSLFYEFVRVLQRVRSTVGRNR